MLAAAASVADCLQASKLLLLLLLLLLACL
jgi:hypothetical protein